MTQLGGVLLPLPNKIRMTIEKVLTFTLHRESHYDSVYGYVAFTRIKVVLWSNDSSIGWICYSSDTVEVSNVLDYEQVSNRGTVSGARCDLEEYGEARVFVHAGQRLLSVVDVQRQFAK